MYYPVVQEEEKTTSSMLERVQEHERIMSARKALQLQDQI